MSRYSRSSSRRRDSATSFSSAAFRYSQASSEQDYQTETFTRSTTSADPYSAYAIQPSSIPLSRSRRNSFASNISFGTESLLPSTKQSTRPSSETPAPIPDEIGTYKLLDSFKIEASEVRVAKWQSTESGLSVVWVDKPGPIVNGYIQVRTEIWDDSGRPHTLEHLTFCGSEKYPYNGVLDRLGNRMLASGTNAWTETLATVYTSSIACEEGFLKLLPVYMDHVLYPTLTDSAFTTEVHNINGKGEDGGVVFSEMQGCATDVGSLMQLKLQRTLYNQDNANRSETGGLMENLRKLHVDEIVKFHAGAYIPPNMTLLVIGGAVDPTNLLNTLMKKVEPKFATHHQNLGPRPPGWKRPFLETRTARNPPSLTRNIVDTVLYPSKDESDGSISISWIGPDPTDYLTNDALDILGSYLTDTSVSPLSKEFIEIKTPYCTAISFDFANSSPKILTASFESVPTEDLEKLPALFFTKLAQIAKEGIDMERMHQLTHKNYLDILSKSETGSEGWMSSSILTDSLWGPADGSKLREAFKDLSICRSLNRWTPERWAELLEKWYIDPYSLTLLGKPSAALVDKLAAEGKALVDSRLKLYGPDGLKHLGKALVDAKAKNDEPVPPEVLRSFKVPDLNGIRWTVVDSAFASGVTADAIGRLPRNPLQDHITSEGVSSPLYLHFHGYESSFIEITICLFADSLPSILDAHLRELIPLYVASFGTLPINRANGTVLSHEEAVHQLEVDTLNYGMTSGAAMAECVTVSMKVFKENYNIAIGWMKDLLWGSVFDIDRLTITATQLVQDLPSSKEDGNAISSAGLGQMLDGEHSNSHAANLLTIFRAAPLTLKRLTADPESVVEELEALRRALTDPRAMRISVVGNVQALTSPVGSWITNFEPIKPFKASQLVPPVVSLNLLTTLGHNPKIELDLYTVPAIASSFGRFTSRGPYDWQDADLPALKVALQMLNTDEGPLWNAVRGAGLAYGAGIGHDLESGVLTLTLFKSPDTSKAWIAAKDVINRILAGEKGASGLTDLDLEAAKGGYAYSAACQKASKASTAWGSFVNQSLLDRPEDFAAQTLAKVQKVTFSDVLDVLKRYVKPLFDPSSSVGCVASSPALAKPMAASFSQLGFNVVSMQLPTADIQAKGGPTAQVHTRG